MRHTITVSEETFELLYKEVAERRISLIEKKNYVNVSFDMIIKELIKNER